MIALLSVFGSLFSFVAFSPEVRGATLYVGGTGPGNYTTIQEAIDDAGWGATIYVYNGTYYENIVIGLPLSLIGEGRDVTTIDGQGVGDVVYVWDNNVTITGFTVTNAGTESGDSAIKLWGNRDCYVGNNTISHGDQAGIFIADSDASVIENNNILLNRGYGIDVQGSDDSVIANNTISYNPDPAINVVWAVRMTLTNNTMIEGGIALQGGDFNRETWDSHTIDISNTVNGKPVYYWKNVAGGTVPSEAGQVILINVTDAIVKNMDMSNVSMGIELVFSSSNTVFNNTVYSNNYFGIYLYRSPYNTVTGNTVRDNMGGIVVDHSGWNVIANNTAYSNSGITLVLSDNNTVTDNKALSNDGSGIRLVVRNRDNTVVNNIVYGNQVGIQNWQSDFNRIFHNDILDNVQQALDDLNISQWDNDYPSGGNWWSDYVGEDNYSGPNQDLPGSDEIGDTPYVIDADSEDRYPLMARVGEVTPPEIRDVFINGKQSQTYAQGSVPRLNLTAMIDDRFTGNSVIIEANYTLGPLNWSSSQPMVAEDGVFNTSLEKAISVISAPAEVGLYSFCVYAWDASANFNTTSTACADLHISLPPADPFLTDATLSGLGAEDVMIQWNRSDDDGSGENDVVRYDVYRSPDLDGPYTLIGNVTANGSLSYEWTCIGCGEGDGNTYFFHVAANDGNLSTPSLNRVGKFTRPLATGPNLISFPLIQSDESIETVLQTVQYDNAWFYDSSSQEWKWSMKNKGYGRGLWDLNHTMGVWVNVTEASNLTVAGTVPGQATIHLHKGWNLASFPSFNSSYMVYDLKMDAGGARVEGYDPAPPYHMRVLGDGEMLQAGYAYWVKVQADADWIVEVS